ncbi:glycerophosphodiester phosphodiesterase family protein [Quadrisphaera sp. DSM 44207]|uniref:glycerophosphodiester phosphodiesterase family protein n=1 Tax=Quadrisphaera sp. DSM 44207 TaxID=1881057 RepID=UPI0008901DAC|nr:glycerophosphodiester phosphodiesterase family protein [Quadrisphaera sp. DSM 44207]SDQ39862.1 glycerophosphoryl diester phosphodiesterase [Quadrisphaera sp. DSM 44207]
MSFLDAAAPVALAHRGFSPERLENSMAAFAAAVDLGFTYLETDVRATADGALVTFHDATLQRATDGIGAIADLPWSTVARARIAGVQPVPRLEEVLTAWPHVRLNIDVKHPAAVAPLVDLLASSPGASERVCVASFSERRRRAVLAGLRARGVRSVTSSAARAGVVRFLVAARAGARGAVLRRAVGADCLQVPERSGRVRVVTPALLAAAASARLPVHVWTVDDPGDMHRLLDLGVDGLVTDRADLLRDVLVQRGQWRAR